MRPGSSPLLLAITPAFGGASFAAVGPYVKIVATAHRPTRTTHANAFVIDKGSRHG